MNRKSRRILLTALAVLLIAAVAVTALAEGTVSTLYKAGTALLFDTDNATLAAHAEFSYNGSWFKTLDGHYVQDGIDSLMEIALQTPKKDGIVAETGFTVVANDGSAYSIEPQYNPYVYQVSSHHRSSAILSTTVLRRTVLRLGAAIADVAEGALGEKIAVSSVDGGTQYRIQLTAGDTPELVNAAGTLLSQTLAKRFFYFDYELIGNSQQQWDEQLSVYFDDYDALFEYLYAQRYGERMPEDFYSQLWREDGSLNEAVYERYQTISDQIYNELRDPLWKQYDRGVAVIDGQGEVTYYSTRAEYMIAAGQQQTMYNDARMAFLRYYEQQTGQTLTLAEIDAIYASDNYELWEAYTEMFDRMDAEYLALAQADPNAWGIEVFEDGTWRLLYDYDAFMNTYAVDAGMTVTQRVLQSMYELELGDTDVTVELDGQGRVTAVSGTVYLLVIDGANNRNELKIVFEVSAGQYGESRVDAFDPEQYGVMSLAEYSQLLEEGKAAWGDWVETVETPVPETVTFNGVQYLVELSNSQNDNG